ncbi:MAG: polysaccharide deacetylase family protein [Sedimenticola sp.]|nr:polysaccharide deacetylase family protein [Sedimenticola sp.]
MPLIIKTGTSLTSEQKYICNIIFYEFLGLEWEHETAEIDDVCICLHGEPGKVRMPDVFFRRAYSKWLSADSLPILPLTIWNSKELETKICLVDHNVPVIYGDGIYHSNMRKREIYLPIDVIGSAFFMLSRYEEVVKKTERDQHKRFYATASCAYSEKFINRPIVDEYVEILWSTLSKLWTRLERKEKKNILRVTCDVDLPYSVNYSIKWMGKGLFEDILRNKNPRLALYNLYTRIRAIRGDFEDDIYLNNIYWMMDVNEKEGNSITFYFISYNGHSLDGWYRLDEPVISRLLRDIYNRGHKICLHPSYNSYLNAEQIQQEVNILRQALENNGIQFECIGSRQHYLRWEPSKTSSILEAAGIKYDSTLAYADHSGFRCGTSREFTMFDVISHCEMSIKQQPLILMETTIVEEHYQALGYTDVALQYMLTLKERALAIGGEFTLLWHNSSLDDNEARCMYLELIRH